MVEGMEYVIFRGESLFLSTEGLPRVHRLIEIGGRKQLRRNKIIISSKNKYSRQSYWFYRRL